jgi:hypothetical protein
MNRPDKPFLGISEKRILWFSSDHNFQNATEWAWPGDQEQFRGLRISGFIVGVHLTISMST